MSFVFRIIILSFLFFATVDAKQTHFKVSYDPDYAPFSYYENGHPVGLLVDYWKLWAEQNNYTVEFVNGKLWENSLNLVKNSKVDFFLGTQPYKSWMKGSDSFYNRKTSIFILKDNSKGFSKTAPYIIGVISHEYEKYIQNQFPNSEVIVYEDYPTAFKDFTSKKIDLIYEDKIAIEFYALRNNFFHDIKSIDLLNNISQIQAIAKTDALINIFNEGLKKLNQRDLYEIESKWILNETQRFYKAVNSLDFTEKEKKFIKNTKIKVSASKNWKPFIFESSARKPAGISYELWDLMTKRIGLNSQYKFYDTFTNQLDSIKNKTQDVIFSTGKTKDREKYSIFTESYIEFPLSIVTLKDENFIENIEFLFNKKIAVGKNFTAHKLLKERYPNLQFKLVKSIGEGLRCVIKKECYAYIGVKPSLIYNINKLGLKDLKITGNTGLKFPLRIMIRDDYKILQSILNKTIASLSQDDVSTIVQKWNNVQFEDTFNYQKLWLALCIIIIIFVLLIYMNQLNVKRNKLLKTKVEERTRELVKLNELLELRVEEKTRQLKRSNYLLDEAQKITHLGSFQYNILQNELIWSDEYYKIFGLYPNEIKASIEVFLSFVHKDNKRYVVNQLEKIKRSDKKIISEFKIVLRDGTVKFIQSTSKVTKFDVEGNPLLIIGTILDLTKLKKLEIEKRENDSILAQQSKMAAMGEMLENIAHQWRQPLSVISTASTGIQIQLELGTTVEPPELLKSIKSINEHAQYLSKTIEDFRNFFSPNKTKTTFNIEKTIEKSLYLVESKIKTSSIQMVLDIKACEIYALESELIQVILNILNNAVDALQSNHIEKRFIFISTYKKDQKLYLFIKDNANGIPKKIINRIFEPYFTTKHKSQGTGIGLYMSSQIITKHFHGILKVSNENFMYEDKRYKGAQFKIILPLFIENKNQND